MNNDKWGAQVEKVAIETEITLANGNKHTKTEILISKDEVI
jgi:hypothetical protein